ncbi:MAG: glycosyltransferase family 4 protein, partial [Alphaproteobacteria bacterium]|nr:glycosyltransferase family 4 protein [Alphaproteobacteria bacterium]
NKDVINYNFSTDKEIFYPDINRVDNQNFKIFFYGRPSTPRRCFELGIESLRLIYDRFKDIEINIAGLKLEKADFGFKCNFLGNLTLTQTGELYRKCDAGIAFSGTNLSYLPVELMASGCPVITNKGKNSEWYCNNNNSVIVDPTPSSVLSGFEKLYYDKDYRKRIIQNGLKTSNQTSWENEMEKVLKFIKKFI